MLVTENSWTPELERAVDRVADADTPLWWYRGEVLAGRLGVIAVHSEPGRRVGYLLWRVDQEPRGRCFAVIAAAGSDPRIDLIESCAAKVDDFARHLGCKLIRFCTTRDAMVERMRAHGYTERCYQIRKVLA